MASNSTARLLLLLVVGLVLFGSLGAWFLARSERRGSGATPEAEPAAAVPAPGDVRGVLEPSRTVAGTDPEEDDLAPTSESRRDLAAPSTAREEASADVGLVRGRVYDLGGQTVAGVTVETTNTRREGQPERALTERDGSFEIHVADPYELLVVVDEAWLTVRRAEVTLTSRRVEHPVFVAPVIRLAGKVSARDGPGLRRGDGLAGARVDLLIGREAFDRVSAPLDTTRQTAWGTRTAEDGSFSFEAFPAVPGARLQVRLKGFETLREPAPLHTDEALQLVLSPAQGGERGPRLRGFVKHEHTGLPAAGASVNFGRRRTVADNEGGFTLELEGVEPDATLSAALPGFEPAVLERYGAEVVGIEEPEPVTLWLPGPALAITGRLVTTGGEPCAGWQMKLLEGTETDPDATPPMFAEDYAAGGALEEAQPIPGRTSFTVRPRGSTPNMQRTGEDGAFRMSGLRRDRAYVLRAWNEATLQIVDSEPVPAGTEGYLMRVPTDVFRERVTGRALGLDGTPLENVRVRLTMRVHRTRTGTTYHTGQEVHTGPDGTFTFEYVPRVPLILRFTGEEVESLYHDLPAEASGEGVDVRLSRRGHFRYDGADTPDGPTTLRVLDRFGEALRVTRSEAGRSSSSTRFGIVGGQSGVLSVSERGTWLVLEREGEEVERLPLRLRPGEVVVVR